MTHTHSARLLRRPRYLVLRAVAQGNPWARGHHGDHQYRRHRRRGSGNLRRKALALGAAKHVLLDSREQFFDSVLRFLIAGNVRRGQLYPLCVGAERGLQAAGLARIANEHDARTVAHGCTAAGNDQVRFEVALRTLDPGLEILAPVRDNNWARAEQLDFLERRGLPRPPEGSAYSINRGLWGVTIGGRETLTSERSLPEEAWVLSARAFSEPLPPSDHTIDFERGMPVALDGESLSPVALIEALETLAGSLRHRPRHSSRRHGARHQGPGRIRGAGGGNDHHRPPRTGEARVERPAEPRQGQRGERLRRHGSRRQAARPRCRDIEAFLASSQKRVTGRVSFTLRPGNLFITGVSSPLLVAQGIARRLRRIRGRMELVRMPWATRASCRSPARCRAALPLGAEDVRTVIVDKVASVAQHSKLGRELRVADDIPCEEGVLLAVRVLNNKTRYNQLELTAAGWRRSTRATSSSARSATARRCSATPDIFPNRSRSARSCSS